MLEYFYKFRESNDGKLHAILDQSSGECRTSLKSDLTLYVRKDGNDNNDGLTDSADGAFLTINAAIRSLHRFNAWDNAIKIIVHEGTYEEDVIFDQSLAAVGYKTLTLKAFEGEKVIVTNATTNCAILISTAKFVYLEGLTANISKKIGDPSCIAVLHGGNAFFKNCTASSNGLTSVGFHCCSQSYLNINGATSINLGNCLFAFQACGYSRVVINGTINTQNTSVSASYIRSLGSYYDLTATFTGSATGIRYNVTNNGVIVTSSKDVNYIPGTVAGTFSAGGIYTQ